MLKVPKKPNLEEILNDVNEAVSSVFKRADKDSLIQNNDIWERLESLVVQDILRRSDVLKTGDIQEAIKNFIEDIYKGSGAAAVKNSDLKGDALVTLAIERELKAINSVLNKHFGKEPSEERGV